MASPNPPQQGSNPLEYWHSTQPRPLHPAMLALSSLSGFLLGIIVPLAFCIWVGVWLLDRAYRSSELSSIIAAGIAMDIVSIAVYIAFFRWLYRNQAMPLIHRRRGKQFFMVGLQLGICVTCMLIGSFFTFFGIFR